MQVLLTTLLVKLAVMAASATILVRFRRFRQFLIFEQRPTPDRLTFALTLGGLLMAGVVARLLLGYNAADLTLEGAFIAGLIDGPYAGVIVGALVGMPPLFHGEWGAPWFAIGCGFTVRLVVAATGVNNDLLAPWRFSDSLILDAGVLSEIAIEALRSFGPPDTRTL